MQKLTRKQQQEISEFLMRDSKEDDLVVKQHNAEFKDYQEEGEYEGCNKKANNNTDIGALPKKKLICACILKTLARCKSEEINIYDPNVIDYYYSIALETICKDYPKYDESKGMKKTTYLWQAIEADILLDIKKQNRIKRRAQKYAISINQQVMDGSDREIGDIIEDKNDEMEKSNKEILVEKLVSYMTPFQARVTILYSQGYSVEEIAKKLNKSIESVKYVKDVVWKSPKVIRLGNIYLRGGKVQ